MKALFVAVAISLSLQLAASSDDAAKLAPLNRKDWLLTKTERESLNSVPLEAMQLAFFSLLRASGGEDLEGLALNAFRFEDLNGDGMAELLCRIDVSGRGIVRETAVYSRKDGRFVKRSIPSFSLGQGADGGLEIFQLDGRSLLVGSETLLEIHTASPIWTFPVLHSWSGGGFSDVSGECWSYYKDVFLKRVKESYLDCLKALKKGSKEQRSDALIGATGMAKALLRLEELFPEKAKLQREDKEKLRKLISMLYEVADSEPELDKEIAKVQKALKSSE